MKGVDKSPTYPKRIKETEYLIWSKKLTEMETRIIVGYNHVTLPRGSP